MDASDLIEALQNHLARRGAVHISWRMDTLVKLMRKSKQDTVKMMAADRILDRAVGRAPMQIDVGALRHDQIVYHDADRCHGAAP